MRLYKKAEFQALVRHFVTQLSGAQPRDCAIVLADIATTSRTLPAFAHLAESVAERFNELRPSGYEINFLALRPYVNGPLGLLPAFGVSMLERLLTCDDANHAQQVNVLHVLALVQEEVYYEAEVERLVWAILEGITHVGVT